MGYFLYDWVICVRFSVWLRDSSAVEQRAVNALVVGSIPTRGAKY